MTDDPCSGSVEFELVPADVLKGFARRILCHFGVDEPRAERAAELLLTSDLRGIDSHGVARLWVYAMWLREGHANPRPVIRVERETSSTLAMNGDGGLGIIVGPEAGYDRVLEKAAEAGSAWGTVSHSNHFGIAGYYALRAVERDMIGWVFSNATAQCFRWEVAQPMLGTNPIAVAFPAGKERPIVIDMATSTAAFGKIEIARRRQQPMPSGWVVNDAGQPITDPDQVFQQPHALSPIGAIEGHAVHKGYGLAAAVDLMGGVLSGAAWGPHCPHFFFPQQPYSESTRRGLGHCFSALRVDAFAEVEQFKLEVDRWIATFRATPPLDSQRPVLVHGDPEWKAWDERSVHGIPLLPTSFPATSGAFE